MCLPCAAVVEGLNALSNLIQADPTNGEVR